MYLVTGGTGFLGCYVVRALLESGREAAVLDAIPDVKLLALVAGDHAARDVRLFKADVADRDALERAVRESRAEVVIHLASPLPPVTEDDALATLRGVTQSHLNVLEIGRRLGLRKILWASAISVFSVLDHQGTAGRAVPNDAVQHPDTLYGIMKSANERLSDVFWQRHGVDSLGFRFCQGYGPGKRRGRAFGHRMFEAALNRGVCAIPYGDDVINWQYVADIAALFVHAADRSSTAERVYNTSGDLRSMRESVALLESLAPGVRFELQPGTARIAWRVEAAALNRDLGFAFSTPIEEGFRRTLETLGRWRAEGRW